MNEYNIAEAREAVKFSKSRLLDYLKVQEQKKAALRPTTDGLRQMIIIERILIHRLIAKIERNQFSSDL